MRPSVWPGWERSRAEILKPVQDGYLDYHNYISLLMTFLIEMSILASFRCTRLKVHSLANTTKKFKYG